MEKKTAILSIMVQLKSRLFKKRATSGINYLFFDSMVNLLFELFSNYV